MQSDVLSSVDHTMPPPIQAPPPAPSLQAQALSAFRAEVWLQELASSLGLTLGDIPEDVRNDILVSETKNWVNRKFFNWFASREATAQGYTPEDENLFRTLLDVRHTQEYKNCLKDMDTFKTNSNSYFRDAEEFLKRAATTRQRLMTLEGNSSLDLKEEVQKCVADGWYTYSSKLTAAHNARFDSKAIIFLTSEVTTKFYSKAAGVDMQVSMGRYKVTYTPSVNKIHVLPYGGNACVEGYYHPHVEPSGPVCWGNAKEAYVNAMVSCKPSTALTALRVILTNYNDESPYVDLFKFAVAKNPSILEGKKAVFQAALHYVWIAKYDAPDNVVSIIDERSNEDDYDVTELSIRVYQQVYEGTGIPVSDDLFFRTRNPIDGTYTYVYTDDYSIIDTERG